MKADINDRKSVEALYPRDAFEEDAGRNALGNTQVVYGVRIESAPDAEGCFRLARARHHVGELTGSRGAIFLAAEKPRLSAPLLGSDAGTGAPEGSDVTPETRAAEYNAFIDRILDAARSADFGGPIGRGETRLKGFHGG
ncbi:MAG TPA: hypothetical protein VHG30_08845 [Microvirga sp.]|nr:hypothetical protein [Microvirga sp.]